MFDHGGSHNGGPDRAPQGLGHHAANGPIHWITGSVETDLTGVDDRGLIDALAQSQRLTNQAEAARLDVVTTALTTGTHTVDGRRDTAAWIRSTLDVDRRTSLDLVRRARLVARHPAFLDALRDSAIHLDHLDVISKAFANPRARDLMDRFVEQFIACAATMSFPDYVLMIAVWEGLADADGPDPAPDLLGRDPHRSFNIRRRRDGSCSLTGNFGPETTLILADVFQRFLDAEHQIDRDNNTTDGDDAADGTAADEVQLRSLAQKRADAFMAIVHQAVSRPPGEPAVPLITIIADEHTITDTINGTTPDPATITTRTCRTLDGTPVHPRHMLNALLIGRVRALIINAHRHPLAMGRPGSLYTGALRDAILTLHPACRYSGCLTTNRWLHADHITERSRGGPTTPDNATGTCHHHNPWRTAHNYRIWHDTNGRWHTQRPDGTDLHPH